MRAVITSLRLCARGIGTLCIWTFWFFLSLLAAALAYLAATRELALPTWALRKLETQVAAHGLHLSIGAARFDSTGHLALYDLKLSPTSFPDPLLTAGEIHLRVDPVSLIALRRLDFRSAHAANLTLYLPAQLSPSGKNEPVFDRTNLTLSLSDATLHLSHLSTLSGPLRLSGTATWPLPPARASDQSFPFLLQEFVSLYLKTARDLTHGLTRLAPFENPSLHFSLTHGQPLDLHLIANRLNLPNGLALPSLDLPPLTTGPLQLHATAPLDLTSPIELDLILDSLDLPSLANAQHLQLNLRATYQPSTRQLQPTSARLLARRAHYAQRALTFDTPSLTLTSGPLPKLSLDLLAHFARTPVALTATADIQARTADLQLDTHITPSLLAALSPLAKLDLTRLLQPEHPVPLSASAHFSPGYQLHSARAHFSSGPVTASHVFLEHASADLTYDGHTFLASDLALAVGPSRAIGSYWMNTHTLDYRFLLGGQLQPAAIDGWFTDWWSEFWTNFNFSTPPSANVDVLGRWRHPREVSVFISVDAPAPIVRTVPFDRVHTSLYIRPHYTQATRLLAVRPEGEARGTFSRFYDLDRKGMREINFDLRSTLDLAAIKPLFGPEGTEILSPYQLNQTPAISLRGSFNGTAHPSGPGQSIDLTIASRGPLSYYQFPISDFNADVSLRNRLVALENIRGTYAEGTITGRASVDGPSDNRRLAFDLNLAQALFGQANRTLQTYLALRRNEPAPASTSDFETRTANSRLNLQLAANGPIENTLAFTGTGKFALQGDLAQINIFGALSRALSKVPIIGASSLQLNQAEGTLNLNSAQIDLPDLRFTGHSATINLKGHYRLDTESIALNAKVYPLDNSSNFFSKTFDVILTPVSHALELKLTGSLAQPNWNFLYSPLQIFTPATIPQPQPAPP